MDSICKSLYNFYVFYFCFQQLKILVNWSDLDMFTFYIFIVSSVRKSANNRRVCEQFRFVRV